MLASPSNRAVLPIRDEYLDGDVRVRRAASRGTPMWYYGDEIAMSGGGDPDNRRDFPGGWSSDARNAFDRAGRTDIEQTAFAHVRALMHLRRDLEALGRGSMRHLAVADQSDVFARHRCR